MHAKTAAQKEEIAHIKERAADFKNREIEEKTAEEKTVAEKLEDVREMSAEERKSRLVQLEYERLQMQREEREQDGLDIDR